MRILITGAAGMIGSHAAEFYAQGGHQVIALDNLMRSKLFGSQNKSVEYNWQYLAQYPTIQRIVGDVRSEPDVRQALGDGVDAIIHAAGQPGVFYSLQNPREDFSINAAGTLNVLECVRQISPKARFILCSTNKVYGQGVDAIPLKEEAQRYDFKGNLWRCLRILRSIISATRLMAPPNMSAIFMRRNTRMPMGYKPPYSACRAFTERVNLDLKIKDGWPGL